MYAFKAGGEKPNKSLTFHSGISSTILSQTFVAMHKGIFETLL